VKRKRVWKEKAATRSRPRSGYDESTRGFAWTQVRRARDAAMKRRARLRDQQERRSSVPGR
jgi:hypothetical protein